MPKRVLFDVPEFLEANAIVAAEGGGLADVAALLGVEQHVVSNRRHRLSKKGIPLPRLKGSHKSGTYTVQNRKRLRPRVKASKPPSEMSFQICVTQRGTHDI